MKDFALKETFLAEWDACLQDGLVYDFNPTCMIDNAKEDPVYANYKNRGWFANLDRSLGMKQLYFCKGDFQAVLIAVDKPDSFYCRFSCCEKYQPHFLEIARSCGHDITLPDPSNGTWKVDVMKKLIAIGEVVQLIGNGLIPVMNYYWARSTTFSFDFFINCFKSKPTSTVFEKAISNLNKEMIKKHISFNPEIKEKTYTTTNLPVITDLSFYRAPRMIKFEKVHDFSIALILREYNGKMKPCLITLGMNFAGIIHEHLNGQYRMIVSETMLREMGVKVDTLDTEERIPSIQILQSLINRSDFFNQLMSFYGKVEGDSELTTPV